jgi:outer membrane protein TolC
LNIPGPTANLDPRVRRDPQRLLAVAILGLTAAPGLRAQEPPPLPPAAVLEEPTSTEEPPEEETPGPAPGARVLSLEQVVALAMQRNFALLDQADTVAAAGFREGVAKAQFYPRLTPRYAQGTDGATFGFDASQKIPWLGGTLEAASNFTSNPDSGTPAPRSATAQLVVRQPLLRGAGPNATFYDLTNSRRARQTQERAYELGRQRLAVQVTSAFYNVIAQRQLVTVARSSLKRSESLKKASDARLKVGLASKLDVFRAELQTAQTEDAMVRSEAGLESALEQLRAVLALGPGDPVEPEAVALRPAREGEIEPLEVLINRARAERLEVREAQDQVDDARRTLSLARQNLWPQLDAVIGLSRLGAGPSYGDAWSAGDTRSTFALATSYPLERSQDRANKAVAELDLAARQRALTQRELDVESEVRAAVRELLRIRKSVDLQRQAVDVAAQQRRLATLRYERGLASNFDVVDAEGSLLLARSALVSLLASYKVAEVELKRATGELHIDVEKAP